QPSRSAAWAKARSFTEIMRHQSIARAQFENVSCTEFSETLRGTCGLVSEFPLAREAGTRHKLSPEHAHARRSPLTHCRARPHSRTGAPPARAGTRARLARDTRGE